MPTTRRCMDSVGRRRQQRSKRTSLIALKQPRSGCDKTGFKPNPDKTQFLWCASVRRQHQFPTSPLLIDGCSVTPVQSARDLAIYIDCDLSLRTHVQRTVSRCFASATPDPSLCTVGHTTDASGRTSALPAGLWKRRAGRPSGSPDASTPVGSECGGHWTLHDDISPAPPRDEAEVTKTAVVRHALQPIGITHCWRQTN